MPTATPRIHNARKRLGPDVTAQLVADYQGGASTAVLMKQYDLGKGSVLRILHEAGVIRKQRHPAPEQIDEMVELYQRGWSLVQIGERFDFDHSAVWLWLRRKGIVMRKSWERARDAI